MENQIHIEAYQELFNYLHREHGLILLQSEMDEIIRLSEKVKLKYNKACDGKSPSSVPQANELLPHVSNRRELLKAEDPERSFDEWLDKYFESAKLDIIYKRKDGLGKLTEKEAIEHYKRAHRL